MGAVRVKRRQSLGGVDLPQVYDLAVDGVGYSTTGGYVDDIVDQLEDFKGQIASGAITVTTDPTTVGG